MKGLAIHEVNKDTALLNEDFRLESEFHTANDFTSLDYYFGKEVIALSQYGTSDDLNEVKKGYPVLRLNEFNSLFISYPSKFCDSISREKFEELKLKKDDVLICRTNGNPRLVGRAAIVPVDSEIAYASYLFKIRPQKHLINSATLAVYMNSRFGRLEIEKFSMKSNQVNFSPAKFREIKIPKFSAALQKNIESFVYSAHTLLEASMLGYQCAESYLLDNLGLTNFLPSIESVNIKSLNDSFGITGRLDAEYYQPKYEHMVARITASSHAKLNELVEIRKSIEPGSDAYSNDENGLPFLRVADYSKLGMTVPQVRLSKKYIGENADKISALKPKRDTILFSKDGSVGEAYCLREDVDLITSGAILHLNVKNKAQVVPDYLTLILNSIVVKQQAERDAGGSVILHWRKEEIENVLVPIVDILTQQKIEAQIQESFKLKAESERLLEVAKRAVEIAIEQDEQAGLEFIQKQTK